MAYCTWGEVNSLMREYHNREWGVPVHDDRTQFEHLMMEAMQCGLNWKMMLDKREIFRACFDQFDYDKVAAYDEADVERIMNYPGMIRSRRKIEAVIGNARCFQKIREEFGSFSEYIWDFAGGKTILYHKHADGWIPVSNGLSERISRDLKKRGFKYLGSITVYSHLQSCGIINDHDRTCPCYARINSRYPTVSRRRDREVGVVHFE